MAEDEPYDLMPHREIVELKKQVQELKAKPNKSDSNKVVNSIDSLTKSMDSMLKLFTEAAEELKIDEKESGNNLNSINEKLDKIIEQNKTIAEGMVTVNDIIKNFTQKHPQPAMPKPPANEPSIRFPGPAQSPIPEPKFNFPEPDFNQPPIPGSNLQQNFPPEPKHSGPTAIPSIPFPGEKKPRKKGLFGRLKK